MEEVSHNIEPSRISEIVGEGVERIGGEKTRALAEAAMTAFFPSFIAAPTGSRWRERIDWTTTAHDFLSSALPYLATGGSWSWGALGFLARRAVILAAELPVVQKGERVIKERVGAVIEKFNQRLGE